jgi:DNA-binding CsgD family transcriptional regulator
VYSAEQLGSLVESVYDASVDGARWPAFLSQLAQHLGGTLPTLFLHDPRTHAGALAINVGFDEAMVRAYKERLAERNIWLRSGAHLLATRRVRTSHLMCSRKTLLGSEWYADYCLPLGISQAIGATIHKGSVVSSNIAIMGPPGRPDFDCNDMALLEALMPHMQRALKIHMHLAEANLRQGEFVEAIEPLAVGVILVTASGQVLFANQSARCLLDNRDGLMMDRQGIRAGRSRETNALRALIGCAVTSCGQRQSQSGGGLNVTRPNGRRALQVLVSPIRPQQSLHLGARAVAAIYVTDPEQVSERPEVVLMRLYGLTPAEAKVAALIVRGMSARQAAEGLAISYNTVKSHLKRVFAKTGSNGQGDLIRLIVGRAAQTGSVSGKQ